MQAFHRLLFADVHVVILRWRDCGRVAALLPQGRECQRLVAVLLVCGVAQAPAQYFGQNKVQYRNYDWKSIESDHFEVFFYTGLDSLAMRVLDLAEKTHVVLSAKMGHSLGRRVPLILYGSHNDFAQTNVTPELIDAGTGGFTEGPSVPPGSSLSPTPGVEQIAPA